MFETTLGDGPEGYQFDNALWLRFSGGYAMFTDDMLNTCGPKVVICHDCAHQLCVAVPWIGALLDPDRSHAHTGAFWAAHPGHVGWDAPGHD